MTNVGQIWIDVRGWSLFLVFACLTWELPTSFSVALSHLWFCSFGLVKNEKLQSLNPKDRKRECTEFSLMLISSRQGLLQNQSLETILVCIVVLCFMCDECMRSNAPIVCHMLLSTSFSREQVCSQTIKYPPNTSQKKDMSEQFVSKQ